MKDFQSFIWFVLFAFATFILPYLLMASVLRSISRLKIRRRLVQEGRVTTWDAIQATPEGGVVLINYSSEYQGLRYWWIPCSPGLDPADVYLLWFDIGLLLLDGPHSLLKIEAHGFTTCRVERSL